MTEAIDLNVAYRRNRGFKKWLRLKTVISQTMTIIPCCCAILYSIIILWKRRRKRRVSYSLFTRSPVYNQAPPDSIFSPCPTLASSGNASSLFIQAPPDALFLRPTTRPHQYMNGDESVIKDVNFYLELILSGICLVNALYLRI